MLTTRRGRPGMIVSDSGTEFTLNAILSWTSENTIEWRYIAPGKPCRTGLLREFQRADARDELLIETLFFGSITRVKRSALGSRTIIIGARRLCRQNDRNR